MLETTIYVKSKLGLQNLAVNHTIPSSLEH